MSQEERLKEQVTSYLKESWRRCELQPALDQGERVAKGHGGGSTLR